MAKRRSGRKAGKKQLKAKGLWDVVKGVGKFIKDNKLISKGLSLIPHPAGQTAASVAGAIGLGKRRGRRGALVLN